MDDGVGWMGVVGRLMLGDPESTCAPITFPSLLMNSFLGICCAPPLLGVPCCCGAIGLTMGDAVAVDLPGDLGERWVDLDGQLQRLGGGGEKQQAGHEAGADR